jgi:hypothetical protein
MPICNLNHECKQETHGVAWILYPLQVFGEEPTHEQSKTWGETHILLHCHPLEELWLTETLITFSLLNEFLLNQLGLLYHLLKEPFACHSQTLPTQQYSQEYAIPETFLVHQDPGCSLPAAVSHCLYVSRKLLVMLEVT